MSEIKSFNVKAGSDGRVWTVIVKKNTEDYIEFVVEYPEKEKAKIVRFEGDWSCNGTYAQYNESCPHKEACKEVFDLCDLSINDGDDEDESNDGEQVGICEDETGKHRVEKSNMFYNEEKGGWDWVDNHQDDYYNNGDF